VLHQEIESIEEVNQDVISNHQMKT
jgi:hypothetical protein